MKSRKCSIFSLQLKRPVGPQVGVVLWYGIAQGSIWVMKQVEMQCISRMDYIVLYCKGITSQAKHMHRAFIASNLKNSIRQSVN